MSIENEIKKLNENNDLIDKQPALDNANDILNDIWKETSSKSEITTPSDEIIDDVINSGLRDITINDVKRAESIRESFSKVDEYFNSDVIKTPEDAEKVPYSVLDGLIEDMPVEEASATISYFVATKLALSGYFNDATLDDFSNSEIRADIVEKVHPSVVKANVFTDWVTDVKEGAEEKYKEAKEDVSEFAHTAKEKLSDLKDDAVDTYHKAKSEVTETYHNVKDTVSQKYQEAQSEAAESYHEIKDNISETFHTVKDNVSEKYQEAKQGAKKITETLVDAGAVVVYVSAKFGIGAISLGESGVDYVRSLAYLAAGNDAKAKEVLVNDLTDLWSQKVEETFDVSDAVRTAGKWAEKIGKPVAGIGLSIAAIASLPALTSAFAISTVSGTALLTIPLSGQAFVGATALAAVGLSSAGESLKANVNATGEIGDRELLSSFVAGLADVGATIACSRLNSWILSHGSKGIAGGLFKLIGDNKFGGTLLGMLSNAALAGSDTALFRATDLTKKMIDVSLGLNSDLDVVQELKDAAVSIAGAAFISGLSYGLQDIVRSSALWQKIANKPYVPDYFHNMYSIEVMRNNYIQELIKASPELANYDWKNMDLDNIVLNTPEQTAEARKLFESHKEQLIKDWETATGREWPKYEKDVIDPVTGKILRHAGDRYDAHHILPLSWGGKNTAGNLTPLDISSHKDVHQAGSAFNLLRKLLDVGQGLNTQGFSLKSAIIAELLRGE